MFSGHISSFKIGVSKVQGFGNFELSSMIYDPLWDIVFGVDLFKVGIGMTLSCV